MGLPTKIGPGKSAYALYEGIEYQDFWRPDDRSRLDELERAVVSELLPPSGSRIIDLGCGYGRLADCYSGKFRQIVMFDASLSLLQQACERMNGKAWFIAGDIDHLPFRKCSFDQVLMVRVFHHMPDSKACLLEIGRVLGKDGSFVFSYSNKRNIARIMAYLLGRDHHNPYSLETEGIGTTLIRHHPRMVADLLRETGFRDIQYRGVGIFDKIPGAGGLLDMWAAGGKLFAPILGSSKIAPWILCKGHHPGNNGLIDTDQLTDLLQCPSCGSSMTEEPSAYVCLGCREKYPIRDQIIDLRPK